MGDKLFIILVIAFIVSIYGIAYYYDNKKSKIYWHDFLWIPVQIIPPIIAVFKFQHKTIFLLLSFIPYFIVEWYKKRKLKK